MHATVLCSRCTINAARQSLIAAVILPAQASDSIENAAAAAAEPPKVPALWLFRAATPLRHKIGKEKHAPTASATCSAQPRNNGWRLAAALLVGAAQRPPTSLPALRLLAGEARQCRHRCVLFPPSRRLPRQRMSLWGTRLDSFLPPSERSRTLVDATILPRPQLQRWRRQAPGRRHAKEASGAGSWEQASRQRRRAPLMTSFRLQSLASPACTLAAVAPRPAVCMHALLGTGI